VLSKVVKVSTEELFPANPDILEGVEDLIQLSYLNEPSVLYNLRVRYLQDVIYSKAGPVLIAVNPFKNVEIYGNDVISAYQKKVMDAPHVYAVADAAYDEMMREEKNQSLIISGESGAGKTETAKFAMQYLAALGGGSCGVEYEILKTTCILEAFGNAKTSRNANSSRFGKLIEIHFSAMGKICGAKLETFLLEKSRVVQLFNGERSYHIFYELCAGASPILKERLKLKTASEYTYLSQSDCLTIAGVDDAQKFHKLLEAFDIVQIPKEHQERAFALLAAVLWLGNVSFRVTDNENHVEVVADEAVANAAMLMGCNTEELMVVLSTRKLQAGTDCIAKKLTLRQVMFNSVIVLATCFHIHRSLGDV
jgi:myosin-5